MTGRAITLVVADDDAHWLRAARASGQRVTPFHHPRFLRAAARATARELVPLVVRRDGAEIGVATWLERRRGPLRTVNKVPFPYAGPLVPADALAPTLAALWRRGSLRGAVAQSHQLPPGHHLDEAVARRTGFTVTSDETYVVDTSRDLEDIERAIGGQCRRQIRKAQRLGVRLDPDARDAEAAQALDLALASVFTHHGSTLGYASPLGVGRADLQGDGLQVRWTVARLGDEPIGALLSLAHDGTGIQWMAGVRREYRGTAVNSLLYWDALAWSHEIGVTRFDLLGNPTPAITAFKKQFGGTLERYPRLERDVPVRRWMAEARRLGRTPMAGSSV